MITQDMGGSRFRFPTAPQIEEHNRTATVRSPYLFGQFAIPHTTRYTEYAVDFCADHLPRGTYCCLGNWSMDYSSVEREYGKLQTDPNGIHAYAGFQSLEDGRRVSILSFWDVFYKDSRGQTRTIRAKRTYPAATDRSEAFGGEGTGAHCLVPYPWQAGRWYRMYLRCRTDPTTGNTLVEQYVCDLETNKENYTLLCRYDVGVRDACFKGPMYVFLENFIPRYAGDVRSLQVRAPQYRDAATRRWHRLTAGLFTAQGGLPHYEGSYDFGSCHNRFWMITSGVGGDWFGNGKGRKATTLTTK